MVFSIDRFHLFVLLTWQFSIFFASQMLFPIFSNFVPKWRCINSTTDFSDNCTVLEACQGNVEYQQMPFASAALEFDWRCGNAKYYRASFSQAQFFGVLVGTFLFGTLSDALGRRPVALFVYCLGIGACVLSGLAPSPTLLLALRALVGLGIGGVLVVGLTLVMEHLLPEQRMALRAFFNWGVARVALALVCYCFPAWRSASMVCAAISAPAILIVAFIMPESPTWLHNKNKFAAAEKSDRKVSRIAGRAYSPVERQPPQKNKSLGFLLRTRELRRRVLVLWNMWLIGSICSYGADLYSSQLPGDLFLNQALIGGTTAISKMMLVAVDTYFPGFNRRKLHQGSLMIVIACFTTQAMLSFAGVKGFVELLLFMLGTIFMEYTWDACYLCAVESMPTTCRASATGSCSLSARVGALIAPYLSVLDKSWPGTIYAVITLLAIENLFVSYFWLVETKGIRLDNVQISDSNSVPEEPQANSAPPHELKPLVVQNVSGAAPVLADDLGVDDDGDNNRKIA